MKGDKFTKIVLTVIAVNLTIITFKNLNILPKAYANEPYNKLELVPNISYGLVPLNEDGTISAKLSAYDEIDVNIVGINTNDELDVNTDQIGGGYVSYGGPISVKLNELPRGRAIEVSETRPLTSTCFDSAQHRPLSTGRSVQVAARRKKKDFELPCFRF